LLISSYCKELIAAVNLLDIDRKLQLYKQMFYCNEPSDRLPTHIRVDALRIELMAGGLSWKQQDYVIEQLQPSGWGDVSIMSS
jgi:zinc finger CCCH domain-containing protein 13